MSHNATRTNDGILSDHKVGKNGCSGANGSTAFDHSGFNSPVLFGLEPTPARGRSWVRVINKRHAVADEDVVFDGYSLTHESVTRDLATIPHGRILLDFDKSANLCLVTNLATIEIDEFG